MSLADTIQAIKGRRALVIGDLMLDEYILGRATRISPEAPVMVVRQQSTMSMPGGAANVAKNINALGGHATILGVVGCDGYADVLKAALEEYGIDDTAVVHDPSRPTTRKTRVLADHAHQVLRIDHEDESPLDATTEQSLIEQAMRLIESHHVVVMSDYLKGALTAKVAGSVIRYAQERGVPTVVNPKPRSLGQYASATIVSLNRAEASEALKAWHGLEDEDAAAGAAELREKLGVKQMLVTLGESGLVSAGEQVFRVPAPTVEVADPAGAGDTIVATVALGAAAGADTESVLRLATQVAAAVVRHVGVATPSDKDLQLIVTNG